MRRVGVAALALAAWCVAGGAADAAAPAIEDFKIKDAGALANLCATQEGSALYAEARQYCYGFIAGAASMYREAVAAGAMRRTICAPTEPSVEEIRAAFVTWAGENPGSRSEAPVDALFRAAAAAYPCR